MDEIVTVYEFEVYDRAARRWKRVEQRGTVEAITRIGGVAIQSSALTVDASRVGPDGFVPSGTG